MKSKDDKIDEVLEVVGFIKDRMVTKDQLQQELAPIRDDLTALKGKVDGVYNLIDQEVDKRKQIEVRVGKLEAKAH